MDYKAAFEAAKRIESLLVERFGAHGRGMHKKIDSVEDKLSALQIRGLRVVAASRNKLAHEADFSPTDLPDDYEPIVKELAELLSKRSSDLSPLNSKPFGTESAPPALQDIQVETIPTNRRECATVLAKKLAAIHPTYSIAIENSSVRLSVKNAEFHFFLRDSAEGKFQIYSTMSSANVPELALLKNDISLIKQCAFDAQAECRYERFEISRGGTTDLVCVVHAYHPTLSSLCLASLEYFTNIFNATIVFRVMAKKLHAQVLGGT